MRVKRILPWGVALILYVLFLAWYMPWGGPLTTQEIDAFIEGRDFESEARKLEFRRFLEDDDGGSFVMVNLIHLKPGGEEALGRYMEYMWPALFRRACHPIYSGDVTFRALDLWGLEDAEHWSTAALMRYRSMRDMLQIAGNTKFSESHEFKFLAMQKTIAVPTVPGLNLGDPRLMLLLVLLLAASLVARRPYDFHSHAPELRASASASSGPHVPPA